MLETIQGFLSQISFSLISSIVAAIFAIISFIVSRRTERRQMAVQSHDVLLQFDAAVREWGRDTIETITALEAAAYAAKVSDFNDQIAQISGKIDQGRLLLPNTPRSDGSDIDKPEAYTGHRPPVLENLYAIYDYAASVAPDNIGPETAGRIFRLRRAFVAELVTALDTKRNKSIREKLDKTVRTQFQDHYRSSSR